MLAGTGAGAGAGAAEESPPSAGGASVVAVSINGISRRATLLIAVPSTFAAVSMPAGRRAAMVFHSPRLMYRSGVVTVFAFFSSVCLSIGERRFSSAVVNGAELVPSADAPRVFGVEHHPSHCSARVDPGIQLRATERKIWAWVTGAKGQ